MLKVFSPRERLMLAADRLLKSNQDPKAALDALVQHVTSSTELLMALLDMDETAVRERVIDLVKHVKTHGVQVQENLPAAANTEPFRATAVSAYVKRNPDRREAKRQAHLDAANAILSIDGDDIRAWTLGRCLTASRHKTFEARVLHRLAEPYAHTHEHTEEIGQLYTDEQLHQVVAEEKQNQA